MEGSPITSLHLFPSSFKCFFQQFCYICLPLSFFGPVPSSLYLSPNDLWSSGAVLGADPFAAGKVLWKVPQLFSTSGSWFPELFFRFASQSFLVFWGGFLQKICFPKRFCGGFPPDSSLHLFPNLRWSSGVGQIPFASGKVLWRRSSQQFFRFIYLSLPFFLFLRHMAFASEKIVWRAPSTFSVHVSPNPVLVFCGRSSTGPSSFLALRAGSAEGFSNICLESPGLVWNKWLLLQRRCCCFRNILWRVPATVLCTCLPVFYLLQCWVKCRRPYTSTIQKTVNHVAAAGVFFGLISFFLG